jgi:hypothetical protein
VNAGIEAILERAAYLARCGQRHLHQALIQAGDYPANVDSRSTVPLDPGEAAALRAVHRHLGDETITTWMARVQPTGEQTAELLEEVLFQVQLGT